MQNLRQHLPPLDLLVSFEAAARLQSFTRAAAELNVTQSAVSQQIRALEGHLGARLFERAHKAVRLTPAGVEFQQSVSAALAHLANASRHAAAEPGAARVTLAADQSIVAMWLVPRLARLAAACPDLALRIVASDVREDSFAETVDIALVHGEGAWPGFAAERFFTEEVFPVCAPSYLEANPFVETRDGLASAFLLDLEYEQWNWMNWSIWLTERGLPMPPDSRRLLINNYPMLIDAARAGLGVALGWRRFVDDDLLAGRLVRVTHEAVTTRSAYWLVWRYRETMPEAVAPLRDWLLGERDAQRLHQPLRALG